MDSKLPDPLRRIYFWGLFVLFSALVLGAFFLGSFLVKNNSKIQSLLNVQPAKNTKGEVFGFAPFWSLSKLDSVDWDTLTTFAYFSLPVNADGTIDKSSFEWQTFNGSKLASLFKNADDHKVRKVVTLTQMNAWDIETFLVDESSWSRLAEDSVDVLRSRNLDGVNIDFEYIPSDDKLKSQFSKFISYFSGEMHKQLKNPYVTVSVLASSVRFNKIYDVASLAKSTDGIFMMAYDYYTPGSRSIGPSAPLYGYNDGRGPFWYDVSTAVEDFIKVADPKKIILGVPYYGWDYNAYVPAPLSNSVSWTRATPTTADKIESEKLLSITPVGGWDNNAKVSWRGYWDNNGWHVVYMEDKNSLALKYDFAKEKNLAGVGIWALGYDANNDNFWSLLREKFAPGDLAYKL